MNDIKIHPACLLFPEMTDEEFAGLKADIKAHGQRESCVFHQDQLLDGRHRWRACQELGIEPDVCEIDADDFDPVAYVLSVNMHRRHLSTSQRSVIGAEAETMLAVAAKERQREAGKQHGRGQEKQVADLPQPIAEGKARDQAAKLVGVSPRMISDAKAIKQADPALADEVRKGNISVHAAKKKLAPPPAADDTPMALDDRLLDLLANGKWRDHTELSDDFRGYVPKEVALALAPVEGDGRWQMFRDVLALLIEEGKIEKRIVGDDIEYRLVESQPPAVPAGEHAVDVIAVAEASPPEDENKFVLALEEKLRSAFAEVRQAWPQGRPGDLLALIEELAEGLCEGAEPPKRRRVKPSWSQRKVSANQITKLDDLLFEIDARLAANDSRTAIKRWVQRSRQAVGKLLKPPGHKTPMRKAVPA